MKSLAQSYIGVPELPRLCYLPGGLPGFSSSLPRFPRAIHTKASFLAEAIIYIFYIFISGVSENNG